MLVLLSSQNSFLPARTMPRGPKWDLVLGQCYWMHEQQLACCKVHSSFLFQLTVLNMVMVSIHLVQRLSTVCPLHQMNQSFHWQHSPSICLSKPGTSASCLSQSLLQFIIHSCRFILLKTVSLQATFAGIFKAMVDPLNGGWSASQKNPKRFGVNVSSQFPRWKCH